MSTGALFHDEKSKTTGVGMSDWVISERVLPRWWCIVAFMKATNLTAALQWPMKWPSKWLHVRSK